MQKYNCTHHHRWQKDCTKIEDSFHAPRIMRHVGKELSQPAPTRNKQKDTLGEKWTRAVLSQSTETMRGINNIIYKEPKSPSQPNQRAKLEPEKSLWKQMVESQNPLKKSMETTTQTKRQMSNVKNGEPKQDTKETTKQTDATITSANKNERMHGRQRPKELEGGGHGHQDRGISCIEPPQQQTLCATMPQGCGTVTMYNKVRFMHLFASLLPQSKLRLVEIGTNGPFVLEIFTERESAFTTENLRMQTRPS